LIAGGLGLAGGGPIPSGCYISLALQQGRFISVRSWQPIAATIAVGPPSLLVCVSLDLTVSGRPSPPIPHDASPGRSSNVLARSRLLLAA